METIFTASQSVRYYKHHIGVLSSESSVVEKVAPSIYVPVAVKYLEPFAVFLIVKTACFSYLIVRDGMYTVLLYEEKVLYQ